MAIQLSRTEQKRRIKEVEQLVRELIELPGQEVKKLPCDQEIVDLFVEAQPLKGGARKRQIKYLTKVLKNEEKAELYAFVEKKKGVSLQQKKDFHELEYLRESLLAEAIEQRKVLRSEQQDLTETWSSTTVRDIQNLLPSVDPVALSRLSAIFARTRQPRHSREIFRLLRAARLLLDRENVRDE